LIKGLFYSFYGFEFLDEKLNEKQDDYLNEKIKSTKIQNENDRLKSKIKELENYIGHLPTNDEVNEKDSKVSLFG
jgi:hypothetical protein